jgi:hypothetical protein
LLTSFGLSIQYDEDLNGNKDIESIQRKSDGTYEVKEPSRRVLSVLRNEIQGFATYPNPVTNNIFAVKSNSADTKQVSIFNVLGKRVLSSSITGVQADIDVSSISAGLYILKVTEGTKTATSKLVIR